MFYRFLENYWNYIDFNRLTPALPLKHKFWPTFLLITLFVISLSQKKWFWRFFNLQHGWQFFMNMSHLPVPCSEMPTFIKQMQVKCELSFAEWANQLCIRTSKMGWGSKALKAWTIWAQFIPRYYLWSKSTIAAKHFFQ